MRAAGAGIPAFYTPTAVGTELAEGRETRVINGREYLLEYALPLDYAFIRATRADTFGNLQFHRSQRNFCPVMATAARITIAEVDEDIVPAGAIDPDQVHTPGIFVHRLVKVPPRARRTVADNAGRSDADERNAPRAEPPADGGPHRAANSRTAGSSTWASAFRRCARTPTSAIATSPIIRRTASSATARSRRPGEEDLQPGQCRRAERHAEAGRGGGAPCGFVRASSAAGIST